MAYPITEWLDEVDQYEDRFTETQNSDGTITHTKVRGTVQQQGTPLDAARFNNMEFGIYDAHAAALLLINAHQQNKWRIEDLETATAQETGTKALTNTGGFLFNNSKVTVPLTNTRDNLNYIVEVIEVTATGGPAGEIEITERQVNGFKMAFTGSAKSVSVKYAVIGGFD